MKVTSIFQGESRNSFVDLKAQYDSIKNEIDQTIYNVIQDSAY